MTKQLHFQTIRLNAQTITLLVGQHKMVAQKAKRKWFPARMKSPKEESILLVQLTMFITSQQKVKTSLSMLYGRLKNSQFPITLMAELSVKTCRFRQKAYISSPTQLKMR